MSSLLQSFLDPKKNSSAAHHVKAALSRRLRNCGYRCNEVESKEVFNRLPRETVDAQNHGLKRAMDLSARPGFLPQNLQLNSTLSITFRISGMFLSAVVFSFYLIYLKMGPICLSFNSFYQFLFYSSKLHLVTLELSALAIAYHIWGGIRHLRQDFGGLRGKRLK
ncbi:hypothetical protein CRG98_035214 [Punica granatum]|uniref:Succinate dehydrogenase subunit 3-1, mitochondrial-like n=1 Tax=Punica granatum TaxID=22663 RepID=A0A2I0IKW0_PUNGR|nr:hypothetical protein CRG98_035214 [Punica granatum]